MLNTNHSACATGRLKRVGDDGGCPLAGPDGNELTPGFLLRKTLQLERGQANGVPRRKQEHQGTGSRDGLRETNAEDNASARPIPRFCKFSSTALLPEHQLEWKALSVDGWGGPLGLPVCKGGWRKSVLIPEMCCF